MNTRAPAVESEELSKESRTLPEAQTMPPLELTVTIPLDHDLFKPLVLGGPHGPISMPVPDNAYGGMKATLRIAPEPDFTLKVPEEFEDGAPVVFALPDGRQITTAVPPGLRPGDQVRFQHDGVWRASEVPAGCRPGR